MSASCDVPVPTAGRLLGVDFGTKRLGLAVSNTEQTIASPMAVWPRRDAAAEARQFQKLVSEYTLRGLVVGLPVHLSGIEGGKAREARVFGDWLAQQMQLPLCYWDERFTSAQAEQYLLDAELTKKQRKARIDMLAAQILLQSYLDGSRGTEAPGAFDDRPRRSF